jgi:hypothetical protein
MLRCLPTTIHQQWITEFTDDPNLLIKPNHRQLEQPEAGVPYIAQISTQSATSRRSIDDPGTNAPANITSRSTALKNNLKT